MRPLGETLRVATGSRVLREGGSSRRLGGAASLLALAVLACVPIAASGPGAVVAFAGGANPPTCGIFGTAQGSRGGLGIHVGRSRLMGGALLQGAACRSERERRRLRLREQTSVGMGSGSTSVGASEEDGASSVLEGRDDGVVEEMEDDGFDEQMFLGLSEPSYDDTMFSEDSDRPAWNWDGEFIRGDSTARYRISGLDSWDTYDDFYDPMSTIIAERAGFTVPEVFDWNATTGDNYGVPGGDFFGPYRAVRAELDYTYHVNYQESRQRLQDEIVSDWVSGGVTSDKPWMIFTAGAMGSGKSHALRMMEEGGVRMLRDMVKVDPDRIKYQLPEMNVYIARNPGPAHQNDAIVAGVATHNESGFIQELIVRELMEQGKNLVVDGSLADAGWYVDYIQNIRQRYPNYRIAIMHVRCNPGEIMRRVTERCVKTGRCIATTDVERSIRRTPQAVRRLSGLVDLLVEVENSAEIPYITSISMARNLFPDARRDGEKTAWAGMSRWTNPKFWRSRTATARRQARSVVGDNSIHPHLRRFWLLDDQVEDELQEGFEVLQEMLEEGVPDPSSFRDQPDGEE